MTRFLSFQKLLCPFCLNEIQGSREEKSCLSCEKIIPSLYLQHARDLEPLPVQAIGWSGHGKSVFLSALTLLLTRMQVVWENYSWHPGNEETKEAIEVSNRYLESGSLPPSTPLGTADAPCLLLLRGMDRWGGRALVYRDCAGEHFDKLSIPVKDVPFLLKARTIFLIASPENLAMQRERTIDILLNGLLTTFSQNGIDLSKDRRRLVVVLTKADLIRNLPVTLRDYLVKDRVWRTLEQGTPGLRFDVPATERYLDTMTEVDRQLREWVEKDAPGRHLVRLATGSGLDLRFSLVSATGGPVHESEPGNRLENRWDPRRLLDPLLWALSFENSGFRTDLPALKPLWRRFFGRYVQPIARWKFWKA
jgi:hypothetical protein